jgi:hypothetical protein
MARVATRPVKQRKIELYVGKSQKGLTYGELRDKVKSARKDNFDQIDFNIEVIKALKLGRIMIKSGRYVVCPVNHGKTK